MQQTEGQRWGTTRQVPPTLNKLSVKGNQLSLGLLQNGLRLKRVLTEEKGLMDRKRRV